jgi:cyclase
MSNRPRVIPCLLLQAGGLVKTKKFRDPVYIGDPVNAVRIFNDKEVDEIVIFDIDAAKNNCGPNFELIAEIAGEAFMPMTYGGGVRSIEHIRRLIRAGVEKVAINLGATDDPSLLLNSSRVFGRQAIVGAVDVKNTLFRDYKATSASGCIDVARGLIDHILYLQNNGVGEIFVNHIDRDGCMQGYDISLLKKIKAVTKVPVVACGGAGHIGHLAEAVFQGGVDAVAAGSMFVFHGKHNAVLITYPTKHDLDLAFKIVI